MKLAHLVWASSLLLLACGDEGAPLEGMDGGGGPAVCVVDADCDDLLYCNGAEVCEPGSADANALGCVAGSRPCAPGLCVESERRCMDVDCPDADGDGFASAACGGDDCDDADGSRFPGAAERCDFVDDDCDPTTLGDRDADGDGEVSSLCCNGDACGPDCDDTAAGVGPTSPEVCNGVDDDCDGDVDEGVLLMAWPDSDRDGWGDADSVVEQRCDLPSDRASRGGDCDDLDAARNPDAIDVCDGVDQDCDGTIDEGADARCDDALGPLTVGACVSPPDGTAPRCHGLRCVGGGDVCGASPNNACDANLCMSSEHCGECGRVCLDCAGGVCPGGGLSFVNVVYQVRDFLDDTPVVAATRVLGSCEPTAGSTDDGGLFVLGRESPPDPPVDGVAFSASGYLTTLAGFAGGRLPLLAVDDYEGWLADPAVDQARDPELGVVIVEGSLTVPVTDLVHGPAFMLLPDGSIEAAPPEGSGVFPPGAVFVYPNVLPGTYTVQPWPTGCMSSDCEARTGLRVEGARSAG